MRARLHRQAKTLRAWARSSSLLTTAVSRDLLHRHGDAFRTAEVTAHCDILGIRRPRKLTAKFAAPVIRQIAYQLTGRGDEDLQGCSRAGAGRFYPKSCFRAFVFGACDRNGVSRRRCGVDGERRNA